MDASLAPLSFVASATTDTPVTQVVASIRDTLHELAHLWVGEPGISGGDPMDPVEAFCNRVASGFLLPWTARSS